MRTVGPLEVTGRALLRAKHAVGRREAVTNPVRTLTRLPVAAVARSHPERIGSHTRVVRFDRDLRITLDLREHIDQQIFLYGMYEPIYARLFCRLVAPGDTVVDAGAHIGQYTLLAAKRVGPSGSVLSFEPNRQTRGRLERNIALNGFGNRVTVFDKALSNEVHEAKLWVSDDPHNLGGASLGGQAVPTASETVSCVPLDHVMREWTGHRIDLVKVDVEGYEDQVFEGAAAILGRDKPAILFEVNGLFRTETAVTSSSMSRLHEFGYRLFSIRRTALGRSVLTEVRRGSDVTSRRAAASPLNLLALHIDADRLLPPAVSLAD